MLKILCSVYACCPEMGSEPGMGWNWCYHLAKHCELYIITEKEFAGKIETTLPHIPQGKNMHFYYNPVPNKVRKMCWNQGNWLFYIHYKAWQKRTADIARQICNHEDINILHQLNMVGFREPGYLWKLSAENNIPFIWGPIGGLKRFPLAYAKGSGLKMWSFLYLKNLLNIVQIKFDKRVDAAIRQASLLIASIPSSYEAIKKYKAKESVVIPETGTVIRTDMVNNPQRFNGEYLTLLWAGKFDFRKKLDLAISTISLVTSMGVKVRFKVFGSGNKKQTMKAMLMAKRNGVESIIEWMGNCPNEQVIAEMKKADLFFFTSVNEETSTVVLEAISCHLPVLCFDTCGMSTVIDEKVGDKIPLSTMPNSIMDFATKIKNYYENRELLLQMSENCQERAGELSWDNKANRVVAYYKNILNVKEYPSTA